MAVYLKRTDPFKQSTHLRRTIQLYVQQAAVAAVRETPEEKIINSIDPLIATVLDFVEPGTFTPEDRQFLSQFRESMFYKPVKPWIDENMITLEYK